MTKANTNYTDLSKYLTELRSLDLINGFEITLKGKDVLDKIIELEDLKII